MLIATKNVKLCIMRASVLILLIQFCLFFSCTQKQVEDLSLYYKEPLPGEILIIFVSGEVQAHSSNLNSIPHAGDWIKEPTGIITGPSGTCILQDGNKNIYYLKPDSHISLSSSLKDTLLHLHQGSIELEVKTPTPISTEEFNLLLQGGLLSLNIDHLETKLSLFSGSAQVLPGNLSPSEFRILFQNHWPLLEQDSRQVPFNLREGMEYRWQHRRYRDFSREIETLAFEGENGQKDQEKMALILQNLLERPDPENKSLTDPLFLLTAGPYLELLLSNESVQFHRIMVDPPEADIALGPITGKEYLELPLSNEGTFTVHAELRGYESQSLILDQNTLQRQNTLSLHKKASQNYQIRTNPVNARIYINNLFAGKGQLALTQRPGEIIKIRVELDEYNSRELTLEELGQYPDNLDIELKKTIEGTFFVSYEDPIGISFMDNAFIVADRKGNLTSVLARRGLRPWGYATANSPNYWSSPVVAYNKVYFSGKRTLSVFDPVKEEVTGVYSLNSRSMHQYGRRVTAFEGGIALPTDDTIVILSPDLDKTVKVINIPGGSLMTPLNYRSYLYCVSNDGRIHKINNRGTIIQSGYSSAFTPMGMSITTSDGKGYFSDRKGLIVCFDLETLEVLWENSIPESGKLVFRDLIPDGDSIYLYSEGSLFHFDKDKGDYLETLPYHFETPPYIEQGILYGAVDRENLIILNLKNQQDMNWISLQAPPTSPVYSSQGMVVIGMNNGRILILNQSESGYSAP